MRRRVGTLHSSEQPPGRPAATGGGGLRLTTDNGRNGARHHLSVQDPSSSQGGHHVPDPCHTFDLQEASRVPQTHASCLTSLRVSWKLAN